MKIGTNNELINNYKDYYCDKSESAWRELCASRKADNIVNCCKGINFNKVLEIGAGEGAILQNLSNRKFSKELYALEISSSGVQNIKDRNIFGMNDVLTFDGYNTNFKDKSFDLVILSHVVEHVEHPRLLLYEANRISKYVFVEVPLEDNHSIKKNFLFNKVGHLNYYNPTTIRFLLQSSGFDIVKEVVSNPTREIHSFNQGKIIGSIKYFIKEVALLLFNKIAPKIFTYQSSILCFSKNNKYN